MVFTKLCAAETSSRCRRLWSSELISSSSRSFVLGADELLTELRLPRRRLRDLADLSREIGELLLFLLENELVLGDVLARGLLGAAEPEERLILAQHRVPLIDRANLVREPVEVRLLLRTQGGEASLRFLVEHDLLEGIEGEPVHSQRVNGIDDFGERRDAILERQERIIQLVVDRLQLRERFRIGELDDLLRHPLALELQILLEALELLEPLPRLFLVFCIGQRARGRLHLLLRIRVRIEHDLVERVRRDVGELARFGAFLAALRGRRSRRLPPRRCPSPLEQLLELVFLLLLFLPFCAAERHAALPDLAARSELNIDEDAGSREIRLASGTVLGSRGSVYWVPPRR